MGDWIADPENFQVFRDGEPLALEPRAVRVLFHLMDNPGRLVTKEELFEKIWIDVAVTDNALTRVVAQLRKSLGDDAKQPRYIETVPTQGYRFIAHPAPVTPAGTETPSSLPPALPTWLAGASGVGLVLLAGILLRGPHQQAPRMAVFPPQQLTTSAGLDVSPTFSPDGTQVAYASDRSGSFEIYVRPVSGGREVQITSDGGQNLFPTWAPDGQRIAFYSAKAGGLRVVPALGGTSVMLADFGCEPAWSPDGKWIAFRAGGFHSLAPTEANPPLGSTIWIVSPEGGQPRPVTRLDDPEGAHGAPSWSPDSRRILFASTTWTSPGVDMQLSLWTVSPDGSHPKKHFTRTSGLLRPRFLPDGRHVMALGAAVPYTSTRDSDFGIYRYDLEGGGPVEVVRTGAAFPRDLAVSADGKRIAYSVTAFSSGLWALPLDRTGHLPSGPARPLVSDTSYRNTMPAFSPDGRKVAYHARRRGSLSDIMVYDLDSNTSAQITSGPYSEMSASWNPDGRSIFFAAKRDGRKEIREFRLATGQETVRLADSRAIAGGRIAGGGKYITYQTASKGRLSVFRRALDGSAPERSTPESISAGYPSVSRDSAWLAVELAQSENNGIGVMPFAGGRVEPIVTDRGQNWSFSWSEDSSKIAFAALRDGAWNLYWVTRDGKRQQRLTANTLLRGFVRYPEWSPKGGMIVYEQAETKGNVFVAEVR